MSSAWKSIGRGGLNVAAFIAVFVFVALLIHPRLPLPDPPEVQPKLTYLRDHVNEYDTLFIGTSRMYRHIIPHLFDQLMAERGIQTHSFNAGVDGMRPPEDAYFFDQILSFKPQHLRWVFLELWWMRSGPDPLERGTNRYVYWHDWERLELLHQAAYDIKRKRHLWQRLLSLWAPTVEFSEHLELFAQNMSNLGRGASLFYLKLNPAKDEMDWGPLGTHNDGFREVTSQKFADEARVEYEKALAERSAAPARAISDDGPSQEALRRLLDKIKKIGATPVLIIPPTTASRHFVPPPQPDGSTPPVFDFSNLQKYPALFEERNRLDTDHLNTAGAEVFTRLLVEGFTQEVQVAK